MSKILVFGHQNPDSDAIGSSVAFAYLAKEAYGLDTEAVALGTPNEETAFVLDYFGVEAPRVITSAKAEGADFAQIAKDNSTDTATKDKGGEVKFDSGTADIPSQVKEAAFKLDENGISDVITVSAGQNYSASYYIVKLNKKTEKGSDWKKYEKRLKEIIVDGRKQDTNYIRSIIAKAMTNANIKVKDDAFKSTFNQYLQNIGVQTSDSKSSSKK